jgi:hypothetical protein
MGRAYEAVTEWLKQWHGLLPPEAINALKAAADSADEQAADDAASDMRDYQDRNDC